MSTTDSAAPGIRPGISILDPGREQRVREIVSEVSGRLASADLTEAGARFQRQTRFPGVNVWAPTSLACGEAGLAVMAVALGGGSDEGARRLAHRFLAAGARMSAVANGFGTRLSLFGGLPGYAAATELASADGGYRGLRRQLSEVLLPAIGEALETERARVPGAELHHDLISGVVGWWTYLSLRGPDPASAGTMRGAVRMAAEILGEPEGWRRIVSSADQLGAEQRDLAPFGVVVCGVAHGFPGLLAMLALHMSDSLSTGSELEPGVRHALDAGAKWLIDNAVPLPSGPAWPRVVLLDGQGRLAGPGKTSGGWCYGTAGTARALWLAGRALNTPEYCHIAASALHTATEPAQLDALKASTLCHGLAGVLLSALHFAWDTPGTEFTATCRNLVDRIIDHYDPTAPFAFRDKEPFGGPVDNPGFLSGAAGVAATLAATLQPSAPAWSRLLLMA